MEISSGDSSNSVPQQSAHWSADRLHADANKAAGGILNLIREFSRISHEFDSSLSAEWMSKRILFLTYELQSEIDPEFDDAERLLRLNRFFFEKKGFAFVADSSRLADPSEALRLAPVLTRRSGAPMVLALIYALLAERIGIDMEFVDLKPTCFMKWTDQGRSRYIDITRMGAPLSSDELIETLHTRFAMMSICNASVLETYSFESYLSDYVYTLKRALPADSDPERLLFLQNTLVSYQPSNLQLIGERAVIHRRLGNFKSALSDLKRFFAFHDKLKAPPELVNLHDDLVQLLERHQVNIEVVD
jgi:regulator of sirC expression with transglutaminase-like and TPR domain